MLRQLANGRSSLFSSRPLLTVIPCRPVFSRISQWSALPTWATGSPQPPGPRGTINTLDTGPPVLSLQQDNSQVCK